MYVLSFHLYRGVLTPFYSRAHFVEKSEAATAGRPGNLSIQHLSGKNIATLHFMIAELPRIAT